MAERDRRMSDDRVVDVSRQPLLEKTALAAALHPVADPVDRLGGILQQAIPLECPYPLRRRKHGQLAGPGRELIVDRDDRRDLADRQRRLGPPLHRERLADQAGAIADFRKALEIDPSFQQPAEGLQRLKAGPASR